MLKNQLEKDRLSIKTKLDKELIKANAQIEELGAFADVVAPESSLGDVITFDPMNKEEVCQRQLKRTYIKKRKLLFMLEHLEDISSFLCNVCGKEIAIERLLLMPKAGLCGDCATAS